MRRLMNTFLKMIICTMLSMLSSAIRGLEIGNLSCYISPLPTPKGSNPNSPG